MSGAVNDSASAAHVSAASGATSVAEASPTAMSTPPPLLPSTDATASLEPSHPLSTAAPPSATLPSASLTSPQPPRHAPFFHVDPSADGGGGAVTADQYVVRHQRPGYVFSETLLRSKVAAAAATSAAAAAAASAAGAAAAPSPGVPVADSVECADALMHAPDTIVSPPSSSWGSPSGSPSPALDAGPDSSSAALAEGHGEGGTTNAAAAMTPTSLGRTTGATRGAGSTAPVSADFIFTRSEAGTPDGVLQGASAELAVRQPAPAQTANAAASAEGGPDAATRESARPVRVAALQGCASDALSRTAFRSSSEAAAEMSGIVAPLAGSAAGSAGPVAARSPSTALTNPSSETTPPVAAVGGRVARAVPRLPTPHARTEASASGDWTPTAAEGSPTSTSVPSSAARHPHVTLTGIATLNMSNAAATAHAGTSSGGSRALLDVSETSSQAGSPLTPHDEAAAAAAAAGTGTASPTARREKRRPPSLFSGSPTTSSPTSCGTRPMLAPPAVGRADDRSPTSCAGAVTAQQATHTTQTGLVWATMGTSLPAAAAAVSSPARLSQRPLVLSGGVSSPAPHTSALSLPSPPSNALVSLIALASPARPDCDEAATDTPSPSPPAAAVAPALLVEGLPSTQPAAHAPAMAGAAAAVARGRPPFVFSPMTSPPLRAAAARPVFAAGASPPLQRERAGSDGQCSLSGSRGSGGMMGPYPSAATAAGHAGIGFTPPALATHAGQHFGSAGGTTPMTSSSFGSGVTGLAHHYGANSFGAGGAASPGGSGAVVLGRGAGAGSASPLVGFSPLAAVGAARLPPPALAAGRTPTGRPPQSPSSPLPTATATTTTTITATSGSSSGASPAPLPTRRRAPPPSLFRQQRSPGSQSLPSGPPPGLPKSPATAATPTGTGATAAAAEHTSPVSGVPRSTTSRTGVTTTTTTTTTAGPSSSLLISPPLQSRSLALTGTSSSASDLVNTTTDRAGTAAAAGAAVGATGAAAPSMRAGGPPFGARHGSVNQNLNTLASISSRGGGSGSGGGGGLVRISHDRRALVAGMFRVSRDGCLTVRNMLLLNPTRIDAASSPGVGPTSGLGTHGSFMMSGSVPAAGAGGAAGGAGSMSAGGGRPVQLLHPQRSASAYSPVSIGAAGTGRMPLLGGAGVGGTALTSPSTAGPDWYSPHTYDAGGSGAGGGGGGVGGGGGGAAGSMGLRGAQHHSQPFLHQQQQQQQLGGYGTAANASFTLFSTSMDTPFSPITYSMDSQRLAFPSPLGGLGHSERVGGAQGQLLRAAREDTAASHYLGGTAPLAHVVPASATMSLLQPVHSQPHLQQQQHHQQPHLQPQRQQSVSFLGPAHGPELHASPTRPGGFGLLSALPGQSVTPVITPNTSTTPGRLLCSSSGTGGGAGGGNGMGTSTTSSSRAPLRRQLSVGGGGTGHLLSSTNAASPPALATVGSVGSLFGGGGPFTVTDTASSLLMPYADIPAWRSGPAGAGVGGAAGATGYVGSPAVHVSAGGFRGPGTGAMTPTPYATAAAMSSSGTAQNTPCSPMPPNVVLLRDLEILSTAVGEGASATVFVAIHKPTGRRLAVKRVDLTPLCLGSASPYLRSGAPSNGRVNQLQHIVVRELQVLHLTYRSPFMVKVYNAFFLAEVPALDIVMEFMHYGSLDHLADSLQKHARVVREAQQQRLRLLPDNDDDLDDNEETLEGGAVVARGGGGSGGGGGLCDSLGGPSPSATPLGPHTRDTSARYDTAAGEVAGDSVDARVGLSSFLSPKLPEFHGGALAEQAPRRFSLTGTQSSASNSASVNASRSNARTTGNSGGGGGSGLGTERVDGATAAACGAGGAGMLRSGGVHESQLDGEDAHGPEDAFSVKSDCGSGGDAEPDDGSGVVEEVFGVTERLVAVVGEQLLRGVRDMHFRGYIHRDIKPGNVLVNEHGVVKLSDFGLSQRCDNSGAGIKNPSMSFVPPASAAPTRTNTPLQSPSMVALQITNARVRRPPFLHGNNLTTHLGMKRGSGPLTIAGGACDDPTSPDVGSSGVGEPVMAMSSSTTNSLMAQRDGMDVLETECTSSDEDEAGGGGNKWGGGRSASSSSSDDAAANCSGTDKYMSPERQRGERHGKPADIWAVGVTLAEFAIGEYPYDLKDIIDEFDRVSRLDRPVDVLHFNAHRAVPLSSVFADFCRLATLPAASQRPTAQELLEHPFFKQWHRPFNLKDYLATRVPVPSNRLKEDYLEKLRGHSGDEAPPSQGFPALAPTSGV